jgi:hypothetical protein
LPATYVSKAIVGIRHFKKWLENFGNLRIDQEIDRISNIFENAKAILEFKITGNTKASKANRFNPI